MSPCWSSGSSRVQFDPTRPNWLECGFGLSLWPDLVETCIRCYSTYWNRSINKPTTVLISFSGHFSVIWSPNRVIFEALNSWKILYASTSITKTLRSHVILIRYVFNSDQLFRVWYLNLWVFIHLIVVHKREIVHVYLL